MLTKEEFKKEYIRMMDSIRDKKTSAPNCYNVLCSKCPLYNVCHDDTTDYNENTYESASYKAFKIIEIVEEWAKEHPDKIEVGDEVICGEIKGVVIRITEARTFPYLVLFAKDNTMGFQENEITKTGRHFPQITEVLEKLKGDNYET